MKRNILLFIIFTLSSLFVSSCYFADTDKTEKYDARLILDVPNQYSKKEIIDAVINSIKNECDSTSKDKRLFPENLLETPQKPVMVNLGYGYTFATCGNAWIEITGNNCSVGGSLGKSVLGIYRVCIYPYKYGYRLYIYADYEKSSDVIGNLIQNFTANEKDKKGQSFNLGKEYNYVCQDEFFNCWFDIILVRLKEKFPKSKIISINYPQERRKDGSLSVDKYLKKQQFKENKTNINVNQN